MIRLELHGLWIRILTREWGFLEAVKEHFSGYAEGYKFHPKYLSGVWDGRVFLMKDRKYIPYGVLGDLLKLYKAEFSYIPLEVSDELKAFIKSNPVDVDYSDLVFDVAPHQTEAIEVALKYKKGIIRAGTGAGKSFIMHIVLRHLLKNGTKKALIIVPTSLLVTQLHANLVDEYDVDPSLVGRVFASAKEWDRTIIISTWQSLMRNHDKLAEFDCVFVDEVHGARAFQISQLLEKLTNATIRLGFTGTLPDDDYEKWCIKSFLGPILIDVTVDELQEKGWLAGCLINLINIHYTNFKKKFRSNITTEMTNIQAANQINSEVFKYSFRLWVLKKYLDRIERGAALLLVGKVDTEGKFLKEYLEQYYPDRDIVFVSGGTKAKEREDWRIKCKDPNCKIILIATYPIFQAGVDIPALAHVFLVAPFKSKIRILQSIGRALRQHDSKLLGAFIYDLIDMDGAFNEKNAKIRLNYYERENFDVKEIHEREE